MATAFLSSPVPSVNITLLNLKNPYQGGIILRTTLVKYETPLSPGYLRAVVDELRFADGWNFAPEPVNFPHGTGHPWPRPRNLLFVETLPHESWLDTFCKYRLWAAQKSQTTAVATHATMSHEVISRWCVIVVSSAILTNINASFAKLYSYSLELRSPFTSTKKTLF